MGSSTSIFWNRRDSAAILVERLLDVVERRRADAAQRAAGERRLEQVARVHRAAGRRAGADERVDLVDEEDRVRLLRQPVEHLLDALLEVAAVAGAGHERPEVERVDGGRLQHLGHVALLDAQRQPLGQRGLAHARLADEQRVVLAPPAEHLHHPLDLGGAADQRIDLARGRLLVQVGGVGLERIGRRRAPPPARPPAPPRGPALPCDRMRSSFSRSTPCVFRKYAAWLSVSCSMKTSRLPVSTCVALDAAACITACWMTRSKATVGSGSTDAEPGTGTKARSRTSVTLWRSDGRSAPQAASCWRAVGSSVIDEQQVLEADGVVAAPAGVAEGALNGLERLGGERNGRLAHEPASSGPASGSIVTSSGNSCASAVSIVVLQLRLGHVVGVDAGDAEARTGARSS